MRYFCLTHRPVEWPLPDYMELVSTVPVGEGVLDLSERFPDLRGRGPELSEYATLFALRRLLQESWGPDGPAPDERMVGIAHYRRFAVTRETGRREFVYGLTSPAEFARLPQDLFVPPPGHLLLPLPARFAMPVVTQYGQSHVVRDLLHFMGLAVDLGVVEDQAVSAFLGQQVLIAAPTVGVYPAEWLVHVLESLEQVASAFTTQFAVERADYQRRAVGFCLERLHALLLAQLATAWTPERVVINPALVISEDGQYREGG